MRDDATSKRRIVDRYFAREHARIKKQIVRREKLERDIHEFILWLTPCGQVNSGPKLELIGRSARALNKKIQKHYENDRAYLSK